MCRGHDWTLIGFRVRFLVNCYVYIYIYIYIIIYIYYIYNLFISFNEMKRWQNYGVVLQAFLQALEVG